nr:GDSL esterase/lipase At1g09390 [Ipomoea batatas]
MSSSSSSLRFLGRPLLAAACLCSLTILLLPEPVLSACKNPPVIFNFGDSNSDTGGLVAGLGIPVVLPNGRTFFGKSTGRLSDGRLVIDFLCQSVNTSFLRPYLDSMGSTFVNGANFAVAGSTTLPRYLPFALNIQILQFLHFKARSTELVAADNGHLIGNEGFRSAIYIIDIGQNDLADSFAKNMSYMQVVKKIPSIIEEIKMAIETIYSEGGRKFWVHNTGPLGCLPQKLSLIERGTGNNVDQHGCISSYNSAARLFNEGLNQLCEKLRSEMKDATIVYVDIYAIKYDLIANSNKYGFWSPLMACCGNGGPPYNYNIKAACGHPGSGACDEGSRFISWDGVHYTEAANNIISSNILSTQYSTPRISFDFFCH